MNDESGKPVEHKPASEAAIERGKVDAERLEEIWELEDKTEDPQRELELRAEEKEVMADFDRTLPPSDISPPIPIDDEPEHSQDAV